MTDSDAEPKSPGNSDKQTLVVGLTGGIGSGKTTVARIFETIGVPVFYADLAAKKILFEPKGVI